MPEIAQSFLEIFNEGLEPLPVLEKFRSEREQDGNTHELIFLTEENTRRLRFFRDLAEKNKPNLGPLVGYFSLESLRNTAINTRKDLYTITSEIVSIREQVLRAIKELQVIDPNIGILLSSPLGKGLATIFPNYDWEAERFTPRPDRSIFEQWFGQIQLYEYLLGKPEVGEKGRVFVQESLIPDIERNLDKAGYVLLMGLEEKTVEPSDILRPKELLDLIITAHPSQS